MRAQPVKKGQRLLCNFSCVCGNETTSLLSLFSAFSALNIPKTRLLHDAQQLPCSIAFFHAVTAMMTARFFIIFLPYLSYQRENDRCTQQTMKYSQSIKPPERAIQRFRRYHVRGFSAGAGRVKRGLLLEALQQQREQRIISAPDVTHEDIKTGVRQGAHTRRNAKAVDCGVFSKWMLGE